jgi:UDP-N-acetylglucosamine 2-epimerase (non-hydrolysing)
LDDLDLSESNYLLMTMHRPSNVDRREGIEQILELLRMVDRPIVFPMHPRTRQRFCEFGLEGALNQVDNLILQEPLGYLEFLQLMQHASAVITDSGGIQEETTYLKVPCLTLRPSTERPVTVTKGTNELLPLDAGRVVEALRGRLEKGGTGGQVPPLWDGNAAERIVDVVRAVRSSASGASDELRPPSLPRASSVTDVPTLSKASLGDEAEG